jgi:hypothetical protein
MNDTLLLIVLAVVPAALVMGIVFLAEFFRRKPSRYYGTFYYKE